VTELFKDLHQLDDQGITIIYNDVEQTHSGIEGEFTWYPSSRLRLKGMASLGDWKFSKNFKVHLFIMTMVKLQEKQELYI